MTRPEREPEQHQGDDAAPVYELTPIGEQAVIPGAERTRPAFEWKNGAEQAVIPGTERTPDAREPAAARHAREFGTRKCALCGKPLTYTQRGTRHLRCGGQP